MTFDRRTFIAASAATAAAPLLSACASPGAASSSSTAPYPAFIGRPAQTLLPRGKAPRVVVCGGGWGGLTTAANLRQLAPQAEVVLLDRNPVFFSSPLSNMWLVNMVDGEGVVDGGETRILLQIFSKTVIGPIFFEFIQRKGDDGFGEGNFKALFESIEQDQIERGVIAAH